MGRLPLAILLSSALMAAAGCAGSDPGQPPVGSISAGARADDGPKFSPNRAAVPSPKK